MTVFTLARVLHRMCVCFRVAVVRRNLSMCVVCVHVLRRVFRQHIGNHCIQNHASEIKQTMQLISSTRIV